VIGIDRDADAVAKARVGVAGAQFVVADIEGYKPKAATFDAVIVMGQSFGHFDTRTNRDLLGRLARALRKDGRIVLDLWNRDFFLAHQGERQLKTPRGIVREDKRVDGDRLLVKLVYPDGAEEKFEWQLFTPAQMEEFVEPVELVLLTSCINFETYEAPTLTGPRMQFILQRAK
jgi:SAM-dependent methyltransferase